MNHALVCQSCGARHEPGLYVRGCPDCRERDEHGRLEVVPEEDPPEALRPDAPDPFADLPDDQSMWRYRDLLPLLPDEPSTLGEGRTPLVRAETVVADVGVGDAAGPGDVDGSRSDAAGPGDADGSRTGDAGLGDADGSRTGDAGPGDAAHGRNHDAGVEVYLKNETANPTGSFKDRLNALLVSNAAALGVDRFALSSSGNHGASTAAYAAVAGADATVVLVAHETEPPLRRQIAAHGAAVAVTDVDARRDLLDELVDHGFHPTVNVTEPYTGRPYGVAAYRTIAFEVVEQLGGAPDVVCVPTGIGDGLYGTWMGFRDLAAWGVLDDPPRMLAAQSEERAPLVRAVDREAGTVGVDDGPLPATLSTAGRTSGPHALQAIAESGGDAVAVPADDVEAAIRATGRAGVFVEPASALAPAAVGRAVGEGLVDPGETVVCLATGAGARWPAATASAVGEAPEIAPTMEALAEAVDMDLG